MCMQIYHIKYIGRLSTLDGQIPTRYPQVFFNTPFADITSDPQYISMFEYIVIFLLPSCRVTWMAYLDDRYDRWFTVFEHGDFP